jgi:Icc protein
MNGADLPVIVVVPGDLHLTAPGLINYRVARWMVDEVNELIRPDFVQFIGDNVQDGTGAQFRLFTELARHLRVPWHALVGDHDVQDDPQARQFRAQVGPPTGKVSLRGFRFLRLNSQECRPLGFGPEQLAWFGGQLNEAQAIGERVVVFQHNYPYKVWETFDGPGIDVWRQTVHTWPIAAILTGHTHYGQAANDGRNVVITTRSIGDPEGGPPGFTVAFFHGDDLAVTYRTVENSGPVVLITHPRDKLLATGPAHVVRGPDQARVRVWCDAPRIVRGQLDDGAWLPLELVGPQDWACALAGERLAKGEHCFRASATDIEGQVSEQVIEFAVDSTGRYTAVPAVRPAVCGTSFC